MPKNDFVLGVYTGVLMVSATLFAGGTLIYLSNRPTDKEPRAVRKFYRQLESDLLNNSHISYNRQETMVDHYYYMYRPTSYTLAQFNLYKHYYQNHKKRGAFSNVYLESPTEYAMYMVVSKMEADQFGRYCSFPERVVRRTKNLLEKLQNDSYSYTEYEQEERK